MLKLFKKINPQLVLSLPALTGGGISKRSFYYPDTHHIQMEPHVLAKRIIKCVGARLKEVDPERWEGVPFTFKTNWVNDSEGVDIRTCIHVHDALQREFTIDIDDRKILIMSIQEATDFILRNHKAI